MLISAPPPRTPEPGLSAKFRALPSATGLEWRCASTNPGGTFEMGSPVTETDREEREGPVHKYAESLPHCQPESPGAIQMSSRSAEEKSGIRSR